MLELFVLDASLWLIFSPRAATGTAILLIPPDVKAQTMLEQLRRLIEALGDMPQTMDELRRMAETIALYGKIALIVAAVAGALWALRMPILAVVNVLRYREMREIDKGETEAADARGIVETAKALKGNGPVSKEDLLAAVPVYHEVIKAARASRTKLL